MPAGNAVVTTLPSYAPAQPAPRALPVAHLSLVPPTSPPVRSCCHVYRCADYQRFDSERLPPPELPLGDKKEGEADALAPLASVGGVAALAGSGDLSLSLRSKFAAAAAAGAWAPGQHPGDADGGGDAFRIGAANPDGTPAHSSRAAAELSELPPDGTPSAPPLSARSLNSARYGRSGAPVGSWAAAGSAPASARGAGGGARPAAASAPTSALPSARSASQTSAGMPRLTPAAEALMPPEQQLLASRVASEAAMAAAASPQAPGSGGSGEAAGEAGGSGSGGSALKRAGGALARLKWKRRAPQDNAA